MMKPKPNTAYQRWLPSMLLVAKAAAESGVSYATIAEAIGKSPEAVERKLKTANLEELLREAEGNQHNAPEGYDSYSAWALDRVL